jgi:hypothetical protein
MSNSAFTPQAFQDFREASLTQSGIVNTVAQSFGGHKLFKSTTAQQITAYGYSTARGSANDNDGEIRLGIGGTSGFRIQQYDSGNTTTYFDSRYDNAGSLVQFRTRTDGTPVVAFQYTGAGACSFGFSGSTQNHTGYGAQWILQGQSGNGTQLAAAKTKLVSPPRQDVTPGGGAATFENGQAAALHIIKGYGTGSNAGKRFTDFVVTTESGWTTPTLLLHSSGINTPNARTYSVDGSNRLSLSLGGSGDIYEVNVAVFAM